MVCKGPHRKRRHERHIAAKSASQNRLEGFALTALFQGFPTFAAAALMLSLPAATKSSPALRRRDLRRAGHAVLRLLTPWLARKFPNRFRHGYEPLFFDASLSLSKRSRAGGPAGDLAATGDQRDAAVVLAVGVASVG